MYSDGTETRHPFDVQRVFGIFAAYLVASLPALLDPAAVSRVAALHELAATANPYFVPSHALLLYGWAPVVALSACVLFLGPGLLLALALGCAQDLATWMLCGLASSIVLVSVMAGATQALMGAPFRGTTFGWAVAVLSATCAIYASYRARTYGRLPTPVWDGPTRTALATMVIVPFLLLVVLAPKFYWEAYNGDGAHAFEVSRVLLVRPVPFFPLAAGPVSTFPGVTSMLFAYPTSWFIRLFGELEASTRLPFLLFLPCLFCGLVAVVEQGRNRLRSAEQAALWLGVITYAVTMAFSATYDPYSADIALPATQDTLLMVCFLGFAWAFMESRRGWLWLFASLTYVALPNGALMLGFWLTGALVVDRRRLGRQVWWTAGALIACVVLAAVVSRIIARLGLPLPGSEYALVGILRRFAFFQFTDLKRVLWVAIPGGIAPVVALFWYRRFDPVARILTLVTLAYFFFFYFQAYVSLHHFVPAMILPVAVYWRLPATDERARRMSMATAAIAGLVALGLAFPTQHAIAISGRVVGRTIVSVIPGYESSETSAFGASTALATALPPDWEARVPLQSYGGSPLVWNHYALRNVSPEVACRTGLAGYVLQRPSAEPVPGGHLVVERDGGALFVCNEAIFKGHIALRPPTPAGSPWLAVPRSTLFRSGSASGGPHVFSAIEIAARLGFDTDAILNRLGVQR